MVFLIIGKVYYVNYYLLFVCFTAHYSFIFKNFFTLGNYYYYYYSRTSVKRTINRVMSPTIRPRDICSGPSTSKAGMR